MGVLFDKYQSFVNGNRICQRLNNFVNSLFFPFIIGLIVVISCNFALEVVCYPLIAILGIISLIVSILLNSLSIDVMEILFAYVKEPDGENAI